MAKLTYRFLLAYFVLSIFNIANVFAQANGDAPMRTRLVGKWQELRTLECQTDQQIIELRKNGTLVVKGVSRPCDQAIKPFSFVWRGNWTVKDGVFKYRFTFSDPKNLNVSGKKFEDRIVSVSQNEWVMIEESTGNESKAYRVK